MKKIIRYKVEFNQDLAHSKKSEAPYDSWGESYSNTFQSITITDSKEADIYSPVNLTKQDGYLVWAEYSTGDSFGTSLCGLVEALMLLPTLKEAQEFEMQIMEWTNKKREGSNSGRDYDYYFETKIGDQIFKMHIPWLGYFENLESIQIECIQSIEKLKK